VLLRYVGDSGTIASASVRYYPSRRLLDVDPGVALVSGRMLECVLLPGIRDSEGNDLPPASGAPAGTARVFRWLVEEN
jgi:hypothetical protein